MRYNRYITFLLGRRPRQKVISHIYGGYIIYLGGYIRYFWLYQIFSSAEGRDEKLYHIFDITSFWLYQICDITWDVVNYKCDITKVVNCMFSH